MSRDGATAGHKRLFPVRGLRLPGPPAAPRPPERLQLLLPFASCFRDAKGHLIQARFPGGRCEKWHPRHADRRACGAQPPVHLCLCLQGAGWGGLGGGGPSVPSPGRPLCFSLAFVCSGEVQGLCEKWHLHRKEVPEPCSRPLRRRPALRLCSNCWSLIPRRGGPFYRRRGPRDGPFHTPRPAEPRVCTGRLGGGAAGCSAALAAALSSRTREAVRAAHGVPPKSSLRDPAGAFSGTRADGTRWLWRRGPAPETGGPQALAGTWAPEPRLRAAEPTLVSVVCEVPLGPFPMGGALPPSETARDPRP